MATQTTTTMTSTAYNVKTIYDKTLLTFAKTKFKYQQFGQKKPQPKHGGKSVEFRRWNLFTADAATQLLTEGTTPSSQSMGQTKVDATMYQYGAYVEVSDLLDMVNYDSTIDAAGELLGEQLGTVLDHITRDAMIAGASVQYGGGRTTRLAIATTDVMSMTEVRKAVRALKKAKARPFSEGGRDHFVCIVSPDVYFDLQSDTLWQDVSKYSDKEQLYNGEIGRMFGVRFVESTEAKISEQAVLNAVNAGTTTSADFVLKEAPTAAEIAFLSVPGNKICIGANYAGLTEYTLHATTPLTVSGTTYTVKLTATPSLTADHIVFSRDVGACTSAGVGTPIHHSLIFGADAYGVIDIEGSGNIQSIVKPLGSGDDPLNQRATVGAKVGAYAAKVLNQVWIRDIETAATGTNP